MKWESQYCVYTLQTVLSVCSEQTQNRTLSLSPPHRRKCHCQTLKLKGTDNGQWTNELEQPSVFIFLSENLAFNSRLVLIIYAD